EDAPGPEHTGDLPYGAPAAEPVERLAHDDRIGKLGGKWDRFGASVHHRYVGHHPAEDPAHPGHRLHCDDRRARDPDRPREFPGPRREVDDHRARPETEGFRSK